MYSISVCSNHPTAVFAAEELKKYLRMMLTRGGDITISFNDGNENSFRLGLMSDFGLDMSDAENAALDDIIYIDTDENGGIIAGSNPCALLIAVYRYLRECGCRWLFPGVDGELIPVRENLKAVKYRKKADHRYRGQCNEGAEFQQGMIDSIDFAPKIGMNTYMLEFDIPYCYYSFYYLHRGNCVREAEPINYQMVLQWKRQCEAEIQKRGMHFHDMGHGWTSEPFGFDSKSAHPPKNPSKESIERLAIVNGKREFWGRRVIDTNVCMSNPENRKIMADYIADYAQVQNNVDFLHIWLADGVANHCECEACKQKTVSDWYVMLLNDIDVELTKRKLDTHLVFIQYTETFWAPITERLNNPNRFTMLYAPISRSYSETYGQEPDMSAVKEFSLNKNVYPKGMSECLAYLEKWKEVWKGDIFCYEYHFWKHQTYDVSGLHIAKLIYDDIQALEKRGLSGIVEDGSQRSFFPTGFAFYLYGETLFDKSRSYDELCEDYFSHAFGEKWREVYEYLCKIRDSFSFEHLSGKRISGDASNPYYSPEFAKMAENVPLIIENASPLFRECDKQSARASYVAWKLLKLHREWAEGMSKIVKHIGRNNFSDAKDEYQRLVARFSNLEIYIERYFDLFQYEGAISKISSGGTSRMCLN